MKDFLVPREAFDPSKENSNTQQKVEYFLFRAPKWWLQETDMGCRIGVSECS
jgi:hypothetical protein